MISPDLHTIDEFILGHLEGEALASFERQLATDSALAEEVQQRKKVVAVVDAIGDLQMRERVRKIHQAAVQQPGNMGKKKAWKWVIAAILILLALFITWFFLRPKETPEKLYALYYQSYPLSFGARNLESDQQLAKAGNSYKAGNFSEALPVFEQLLSTNPNDSKLRLAAGICRLELGQYDGALAHFQQLIDANDPLYKQQALWYSALAYLQKSDLVKSKSTLEEIVKDKEGQFYEKAAALLSDL